MNIQLIYEGQATLEDLYELHIRKGYEFIIEDGEVKNVIYR